MTPKGLTEKIKNRDTELQRAYDSYLAERQKCIDKISELQVALKNEEANLKSICSGIRQCHDRAIEQGCLNTL